VRHVLALTFVRSSYWKRPEVINMIELRGLSERERRSRVRVYVVAIPALALIVAVILIIALGWTPLGVPERYGILLLFVFDLGVGLRVSVAASLPRPDALEVTRDGIKLRYPSGKIIKLTWPEWASRATMRHVKRSPSGRSRLLGDLVQLKTPVRHRFWITKEASDAILRYAQDAGLVEVSRDLKKIRVSGRFIIGTETTFELP